MRDPRRPKLRRHCEISSPPTTGRATHTPATSRLPCKRTRKGKGPVGSLFRAAARAEQIHLSNHAVVIRRMGGIPHAKVEKPIVLSTQQNLDGVASKGEAYERDTMYPDFIKAAQAESNPAAVETFEYVRKAEAQHFNLFAGAAADPAMKHGPRRNYYVCKVSGYTASTPDPVNTIETRALAKRACFDCHSNETEWPWYSNVAPVSWLTQMDTLAGRSKMNFSEWNLPHKKADEAAENTCGEAGFDCRTAGHHWRNEHGRTRPEIIGAIRGEGALTYPGTEGHGTFSPGPRILRASPQAVAELPLSTLECCVEEMPTPKAPVLVRSSCTL